MKTKPELDGVPETLLWTLYHRALEARRVDAVLRDPKAIELVDGLDYPFEARFGHGGLGTIQGQALRALSFDIVVRTFVAEHPRATIVALGAGLETQTSRVDTGQANWLFVELPEVAALRARLLPDRTRMRTLAQSALDTRWMDAVDDREPVIITAQGLFMYLRPDEVHGLLTQIAARFARGIVLFDAVAQWFATLTQRGRMVNAQGYVAPVMPWALTARELQRLRSLHPNITRVCALPLPRGRGFFFARVMPVCYRTPWLKHQVALQTVLVTLGHEPAAEQAVRALRASRFVPRTPK